MISYGQAIDYLDSLTNYEKIGLEKSIGNMDLARVKEALAGCGGPHEKYVIAHVAGTKGKGSVCAYIASILESSGRKTGLFTSPHLVSPLERIKVDGLNITEEAFAEVIGRIKSLPEAGLTYFEAMTVAALLYFAGRNVDVAVLETGMGGRLDATNAVDADICCITPVSYDHMHVLGESIEDIAMEKAGIIKEGVKCVVSPQKEVVMGIIRDKCLREGAEMILLGEDVKWDILRCNDTGNIFDLYTRHGEYDHCASGLPGLFQIANCATAVAVCEEILGDEAEEEAFRQGIGKAFIPGRLEVVARSPLIVLDGAQNAESAEKLKYSVEQIFKYDRLILLAGLAADKDIHGFFAQLAPVADEVILTRSASRRAADPDILRGHVRGRPAVVTHDTKEALGMAFGKAGSKDLILVTGSFYVVGEVRELLLRGNIT